MKGKKVSSSSSSFYFKQRNGKLDLRSITNIDIDDIIRNVDLDVLQSKLEPITFCELNENDLKNYTDQQIIKLFRISQLVIEYLLYAQERLVDDLGSLSNKYNDKKKLLLRKRRELESLKESCNELKSQVKSKKGNIETLENLLKTTVINKKKKQHDNDDSDDFDKNVLVEKPIANIITSKPPIAHFYVSGPDGLCLEFKEKWDTPISDIVIDFRRRYPNCKKDDDIKLVNRGRILLNENTIAGSDIKSGDNIIVRMTVALTEPSPKKQSESKEVENLDSNFLVEVKELTSRYSSLIAEMMNGYGKQQENINGTLIEMRRGWDNALKSLSATQQKIQEQQQQPIYVPLQQAVVSEKFDDKVYKALESSVINKLTAQMEEQEKEFEKQLQAVVTNKPVHFGEIEDDVDEDPSKSKAYEALLESMQSEIKQLRSTVETISRKTKVVGDEDVDKPKHITINKVEKTVTEIEPFSPIDEVEEFTEMKKDTITINISAPAPAPTPAPAPALAPSNTPANNDLKSIDVQDIISDIIDKNDNDKKVVDTNENDMELLNASIESEKMDNILKSAAESIQKVEESIVVEETDLSIITDHKLDDSAVMQLESAETSVIINESNNVSIEKEEKDKELVVLENKDSIKPQDDDDDEVEVSILFTAEFNKDLELLSLPNNDIEVYPIPTDCPKDDLVLEIRRYIAEEAQISLSRVSLLLNGNTIMRGIDVDESFTAIAASKLAKSGALTLSIKSLNQSSSKVTHEVTSATPSLPVKENKDSQLSKEASSLTMSHSELDKIVSIVKKQDPARISHDDHVADQFLSTKTSLDNTLNSLSDADGLTDDELAEKLSDLRKIKQKISPHIDDHHGSILDNLANISENNNNISLEKRPDYLRLSLSNINRRSYDDDSLELPKFVDEPTNINNKSSSGTEILAAKSKTRSTVLESADSLADAKRLDSVLTDDNDIMSSIQKLNPKNSNIFNRESHDEYSNQFDSLTSSNLYGTRESDIHGRVETKNSVNSWDSSNLSDENYAVDLDKTMDSTISGDNNLRMSAVLKKADEYERKASAESDRTPVKDYKSISKASTPSIASPFDHLTKSEVKLSEKPIMEDYDGNDSLALSDDSRPSSEKF